MLLQLVACVLVMSSIVGPVKPGSEYLALQSKVNVNIWPNAKRELGCILAFVICLHRLPVAMQDILNQVLQYMVSMDTHREC